MYLAIRTILTLLTEVKSSVADLKAQVTTNTKILQSLSNSGAAELPDDIDMELPIADREALESTERDLSENRSMYKSLVCIVYMLPFFFCVNQLHYLCQQTWMEVIFSLQFVCFFAC